MPVKRAENDDMTAILALTLGAFVLAATAYLMRRPNVLDSSPVTPSSTPVPRYEPEKPKRAAKSDPTADAGGPTIQLRRGQRLIEAVGESHYQPALARIKAGSDHYGGRDARFCYAVAELRREPSNPADPNAVAVFIGADQVGYLNRTDAEMFKFTHNRAIADGRPIDCECRLMGGDKHRPNIGVFLDFDLNNEKRCKRPRKPLHVPGGT